MYLANAVILLFDNAKVQLDRVNLRRQVGLDHLENLVRLMEELSSLREQNLSLKRKVHDMETEKTREVILIFFKWTNNPGLFLFIFCLFNNCKRKNVDLSGIRTLTVGVEGEHVDRLTTTRVLRSF